MNPLEPAFVDLGMAEATVEELINPELGIYEYECRFGDFLTYSHRAWERADSQLKKLIGRRYETCAVRSNVLACRKNDPLIAYMREARNQLMHDMPVLCGGVVPAMIEGCGSSVSRRGSYVIRGNDSYAAVVLPSLSLDFIGGALAMIPLRTIQNAPVGVPTTHLGKPLLGGNDPTSAAVMTLDFYGGALVALCNQFWGNGVR